MIILQTTMLNQIPSRNRYFQTSRISTTIRVATRYKRIVAINAMSTPFRGSSSSNRDKLRKKQ